MLLEDSWCSMLHRKRQKVLVMIESSARKLNFSRKLLFLATGWRAVVVPAMFAQAAAAPAEEKDFKEFDVASVKENKSKGPTQSNFPLGPGDAYVPHGGHFVATNLPLVNYILFAYKVQPDQGPVLLKQLPDWARTTMYDIEAKVGGDPDKDDMRAMMRALLAERFGLKIRTELQEISVMDLVLAKPGDSSR
jgi:hypothetical protein